MNGDTVVLTPTKQWYNISVTPYTLAPATQYAIVVTEPTAVWINGNMTYYDYVGWWADYSAPSAYAYGEMWRRLGASATWTEYGADDFMFYVYTDDGYTITTSVSAGTGTVNPLGATTVASGGNLNVTVTPGFGQHIIDVVVDGGSVGAVGWVYFGGVSADHTLSASFSSSGSFTGGNYTVNLRVYENGTKISTPYTASIILEDSTLDSLIVSADATIYNVSSPIYAFTYPLMDNVTYRTIFSPSNPITPLVPSDPAYVYLFSIRDTTGVLYRHPGILEAYVGVNSTLAIADSRAVTSTTVNGVPLTLARNKLVNLRFRVTATNQTQDFGYFTPMVNNTAANLDLTMITFDMTINMVNQWVNAIATRSTDYSYILCTFSNLLTGYSVNTTCTVLLRNGTVAYTGSSSANSGSFNATGLSPTGDYVVMWVMHHGYFGLNTLHRNWAFEGNATYTVLPDLSASGWSFGGVTYIIPVGILLFVAGCFSYVSAPAGLVITVLTAGAMAEMGMVPIPADILALAFSLAIIFALGRRDRG